MICSEKERDVRDELLHLFRPDLCVGLDDVMVDQPLAHVALRPRIPDMLLGSVEVMLHLLRERITLLLEVGLDDAVGDEPFVLVVVDIGSVKSLRGEKMMSLTMYESDHAFQTGSVTATYASRMCASIWSRVGCSLTLITPFSTRKSWSWLSDQLE